MIATEPGRKRALHADLNLVPYIDLLTCMVAFLLITAAWTQLAQLEVKQRGEGEGGDQTLSPPLTVNVSEHGFAVMYDGQSETLPAVRGQLDFMGLAAALLKLRAVLGDRQDAVVASADDVEFDVLVATMDTLLAADLPHVSLADATPGLEQDPGQAPGR